MKVIVFHASLRAMDEFLETSIGDVKALCTVPQTDNHKRRKAIQVSDTTSIDTSTFIDVTVLENASIKDGKILVDKKEWSE